MELTITKGLLSELERLGLLNEAFAAELAKEVLTLKEPRDLAMWLLTPEVAVELLKNQLLANPERTLAALEQLPARTSPLPKRRATKSKRGGKRPAAKAKAPAPKRRRRLSPAQATRLKDQVTAFLKGQPGSGRKALEEAVRFPSKPLYHRIMRELQEAGVVKSKGEKRNTVYSSLK